MIFNLPNALTLLRIMLIPLFVTAFYLPFQWAHSLACGIFLAAAFTDLIDGWLARYLDQTSKFGAFLDPVADKLMVCTALILLVGRDPHFWLILPACVIVGREIAVSALREWMAEVGARAHVAVSSLGKFKTCAQMASLSLLIYREPLWNLPIWLIGMILLYIAALLTLWSMWRYLSSAWRLFAQS